MTLKEYTTKVRNELRREFSQTDEQAAVLLVKHAALIKQFKGSRQFPYYAASAIMREQPQQQAERLTTSDCVLPKLQHSKCISSICACTCHNHPQHARHDGVDYLPVGY